MPLGDTTHWPECYMWYHSCADAVVVTQKTKRRISAIHHHCLAVQITELALNFASCKLRAKLELIRSAVEKMERPIITIIDSLH